MSEEPERTAQARKSKAARARKRSRRDMVLRNQAGGCPRPDKLAFDLSVPYEEREARRLLQPDMALYKCRCGWWHLGHPLQAAP